MRRWRNGKRCRLRIGPLRVQVPLSVPLFRPHALVSPYQHAASVSRPLVQLVGTAAHDPQVAGKHPAIPTNLNAMNNPSDPSDLPGAPTPAPQSPPPAKDYACIRAYFYADGSMLVSYGDGTLLIDEKAPYG